MKCTKLWINGAEVASHSGATFENINPADGSLISKVSLADLPDVNLAVKSAEDAFKDSWRRISPSSRRDLLTAFADEIDKNSENLAMLDCVDGGRIFQDCLFDIGAATSIIRYFADLTCENLDETLKVQEGFNARKVWAPYGVVGAICPWNYPVYNACLKIAPALAAGNTLVLKPAEDTPSSALELAKISDKIGFPPGVLNVIQGPGEKTGALLSQHQTVAKISFTGSTAVGREILRASAESNLKAVTLELGGKSPVILFEDCDLDAALSSAVFSICFNQGQTCTAMSRILTQNSIFNEVKRQLICRMNAIYVGDPLNGANHVGSCISASQFKKVNAFIETAVADGATLECGGSSGNGDHGYFLQPTLLSNVSQNMEIFNEEVFGPVLVLVPFKDREEAVKLANSTKYGLAASVWSRSDETLSYCSETIDAGVIYENCLAAEHPSVPVGGWKLSGFGKEYGVEGFKEYLRLKSVWSSHQPHSFPWP